MKTFMFALAVVSLTFAAAQAQDAPKPTWFTVTNHPGWQALGHLNANGYVVDIREWRAGPAAVASGVANRAVQAVAADAHGFVQWLNGVRGQYGLRPVGYDPNLDAYAAQNNALQEVHGLGHHQMAGTGQCSAQAGNLSTAGPMWLGSAPHAAILLDPNATRAGFHTDGRYATANVGR